MPPAPADLPAITIHPLAGRVRILISPDPPPPPTPAVDREWDRQRARTPRLHDGPILSVVAVFHADADAAEIVCRRDGYKRLCVQPAVPTGARLLAVTGILTARDGRRREHVLLGRRSPETRLHGGLWELGPSGGVAVPPPAVTELDERALLAHLADEALEEAGVTIRAGRPVALVRDAAAFSDDVAILCDLGDLADARAAPANWEYTDTRWVPVDELPGFDAAHASEIIPATRALLRFLGWTPPVPVPPVG